MRQSNELGRLMLGFPTLSFQPERVMPCSRWSGIIREEGELWQVLTRLNAPPSRAFQVKSDYTPNAPAANINYTLCLNAGSAEVREGFVDRSTKPRRGDLRFADAGRRNLARHEALYVNFAAPRLNSLDGEWVVSRPGNLTTGPSQNRA
jgi:hypothetical protein